MNTLVLSLLVENNPGVLSRVAGLFSRRGYSIDSLSVGGTNQPNISRMTIVVHGDDLILSQIEKQLSKLVEVIDISPLKPEESVYRELVLIKVEANEQQRSSVVSIADIFRARIIDVAPASLVIEATGNQSKINGLLAMLEGFNIVEIVRTGLSGIKRGLGEIDINSHK
ncbi:acetolactate synthase small subunit [uncultured Thomasclavelia sp.]|uniref:acetolactate synthase small subunit n=1 Tax=uncultured Thomasclavelia sp. TaxID=3025759 RepID=UPI0025EBCED6|nr:acetolactate synthase small subunit [uncultured Thomasclavelia sp.]